jgi:hypothetical protein
VVFTGRTNGKLVFKVTFSLQQITAAKQYIKFSARFVARSQTEAISLKEEIIFPHGKSKKETIILFREFYLGCC